MKIQKVVALFLFISLLAGCGLETMTLQEFYEKDLDNVNKVVIFNGNTGHKKTITHNRIIDDFLSEIGEIKFIPDENQEARDGVNYYITFFQDGEETFQFGLTYVKENYYNTEPDIYPIVDEFYINVDVKEE